MGYFEFLHDSRIFYLLLNISENCIDNISSKSQKRQRIIAFGFVDTIQYPHTVKNNIYHSKKLGPPPFFHSDTNPQLGQVLVHSVDKTHILVVTVKLIWLLLMNIVSFNFFSIRNKSLRFTRFRGSYNRIAVILTNNCQSYTAFLLDLRCSKQPPYFFLQLFVPNYSAFA